MTVKVTKRTIRIVLFIILAGCIIMPLTLLLINLQVKNSVKSRILTPEEAAGLNADCILVLGAGVWENSRPSQMLEDRLLQGVELYQIGASDRLLVSGDHGREGYDEVNVMKSFAIGKGISSEHIFMDHAGFSTYDSMYRARDIFKVKKVIIVTQKYHIYRALYVAEALGLEAYGVASDPRQYAGQGYRELREIAARVKDFFYVIVKPEPAYLGDSIPVYGNGDITNDK